MRNVSIQSVAISLLGLIIFCQPLQSADLLSVDMSIQDVIDHYIKKHQQEQSIKAVDQTSDANLIRRLTLDLAGRIPTSAEAQAYVADTKPPKRSALIERLLSSPDYAYHQRNEIDTLLMGEKRDNSWREYLLKAAQENRPWDAIFREMMIGDENTEKQKPALAFLKARVRSPDDMTSDTSVYFFGVDIACAKCHDHPLVEDWKQDHYYGFYSFFNRTYQTKKGTLAEKFSGSVKFKTTSGEDKQAKFLFLSGAEISEPQEEKTKEQLKAEQEEVKRQQKDKDAPPARVPEFSPRTKLVELALRDDDNRFFARAVVNRIWARFMGYGLVHPLDQLHSENPPSHPELLDWLTRDMIANGYDLKRLIRGITSSQTYSQSSAWHGKGEPPAEEFFARAIARPLSPRQYALSLSLASNSPEHLPADIKPEDWGNRRKQLENHANGRANQFEIPGEHFQVGVDEALYFSNNQQVQNEYLRDSGDRLVGYLKGIADDQELIISAFWTIHSRPPVEEETKTFEGYLTQRKDRRVPAIKQMVWALLTSPELRFNY